MNTASERPLSIGECVYLACVLEAMARKPGNVHPSQSFADVTYLEFVLSAAAIAPVLQHAGQIGVGPAVLEAIRCTRRVVRTNTNLGIVLLLTPLAAVPREVTLERGISAVFERLTVEDARAVYEAARLAQPGGLGRVSAQDLSEEPTQTLLEVMRLAADRDNVARQYASAFRNVFALGLPALLDELNRDATVEEAIIACHLRLMSELPDTLIARKRGRGEAEEAARRAGHVLALGGPSSPHGCAALQELDAWLRAEGHSRNPGTTADLVTACLFAALREGTMQWPSDRPFASSTLST